MSIQINFPPPICNEECATHIHPLTKEYDEYRPIFTMRVQWPSGNISNVYIWQVHPDYWNYYDDCKKNGRLLECKDLTYLLWNFGLSDADPHIEEMVREHAEWMETV